MSEADRRKWEKKYREGAYAERLHPSDYLVEHVPPLVLEQRAAAGENPSLRALDLACGAGRNACYLAGLGYQVDAVDVSREALSRGRESGPELPVNWVERDLDEGLPPELTGYDLIVIIRYLDLELVREAGRRLRPGGLLLCEVHLRSEEPVAGPSNPAFRVSEGELRRSASELTVVDYREGRCKDPDGQAVALARLAAEKPRAA